MPYSVHRIQGLNYGQRRDVAFLTSTEDAKVDARDVFDRLRDKHKQEMLNKFELWQRGNHVDRYFHGFNAFGYRDCFVFKRKEAGAYHRFYGFLIHPCTFTQPEYQVCVLVQHAQKNRESTDLSELDFVNSLRTNAQVIVSVKKEFPESIWRR